MCFNLGNFHDVAEQVLVRQHINVVSCHPVRWPLTLWKLSQRRVHFSNYRIVKVEKKNHCRVCCESFK